MAKSNNLIWVALGIGALFLYSKSTAAATSSTGPTPYPPVPVTPVGSSVGGLLASIFPSVFGANGSYTVNQIPRAAGGAVDVTNINQVGAQPTPIDVTPIGCTSGGNVCDPADCDYNEQVCQELQGYTV